MQQSVLRAFRHLSKFRREASFKTWLSAIVWNEVSLTRRAADFASSATGTGVRSDEARRSFGFAAYVGPEAAGARPAARHSDSTAGKVPAGDRTARSE